ncbi:MAG: PEP-CTERM sorting domain-containing protein [Moorea sp. SIOASIH]|uniref:PEP-CTERM sorting domain-containing protein n=1 Tax=Moorena sp. SIOASIH TaxID=2607817 RepID=UPI0013B5BA80|nr:PEP-CTERM sorting domain-containing protein [Moorena sp. SIOASIH]NEO39678.1 PEP-CTERM sorting domain-containing protein [Moorena sp. SIOASIH]NEO93491.1 PEP-CTERM sorting domain-containing protein [Moorena sp. SIO3G5]
MNITKFLSSGLVLGSIVLGAVGEAQAADILKSWLADEAHIYPEDTIWSGHAFWFPQLDSGRFVFDTSGIFNEYDDGSANLYGTIVSELDDTKKWDVDIWFESITEPWGGPKKELPKSEYVENGGSVDTSTWRYYNMDETRATLTGVDFYDGKELNLYQRPENGKYAFQVGVGANGKNTNFGMSGWLGTTGSFSLTKADINVDLTANPGDPSNSRPVPEPMTMGLFSLSLLGLSVTSLKRKSKELV